MIKGHCVCGRVSFEIAAALRQPSLCHCNQCRRIHGAPGAYTSAPASAFRIDGAENLGWHPTSARAEQGFCTHCGAKLFWREHGSPDLDVTMGSLVAPTSLRLDRHIFTRDQGDYYEIGRDALPRYAQSSRDADPVRPQTAPDPGPARISHSGRCLCGAVKYRVAGKIRDVIACHCNLCQHLHGYAPSYCAARKAEFAVEGEDNIAWYRSSAHARRGFCKDCGSTLFWWPEDRDTVSITAGSLDRPTGLKTVLHIMVAEKRDYYAIADGVPQMPDNSTADTVPF